MRIEVQGGQVEIQFSNPGAGKIDFYSILQATSHQVRARLRLMQNSSVLDWGFLNAPGSHVSDCPKERAKSNSISSLRIRCGSWGKGEGTGMEASPTFPWPKQC